MRDFNNMYTIFQVHVLSGRTSLMERPTGNLDWQSPRRRKRPLWGHLQSLATVLTKTYLILKPLFMLKHHKKTFIVSLESFPARSIIANVKSHWVIFIFFINFIYFFENCNLLIKIFRHREHHVVQHRSGLGHGHRNHHLHGSRVPGYHEQRHPKHQGRPDWPRVEQHHQVAVCGHYGIVGFDGGKFVFYFRFLVSIVLNDANQCPKNSWNHIVAYIFRQICLLNDFIQLQSYLLQTPSLFTIFYSMKWKPRKNVDCKGWSDWLLVKFEYSEKVTKTWRNLKILLNCVKERWEISSYLCGILRIKELYFIKIKSS